MIVQYLDEFLTSSWRIVRQHVSESVYGIQCCSSECSQNSSKKSRKTISKMMNCDYNQRIICFCKILEIGAGHTKFEGHICCRYRKCSKMRVPLLSEASMSRERTAKSLSSDEQSQSQHRQTTSSTQLDQGKVERSPHQVLGPLQGATNH